MNRTEKLEEAYGSNFSPEDKFESLEKTYNQNQVYQNLFTPSRTKKAVAMQGRVSANNTRGKIRPMKS
jgi:hypothetical protein